MRRIISLEEDTFQFVLEGGLAPNEGVTIDWGEPRLMEVEVWDPTIVVRYAPTADTPSETEPASSSARPQGAGTSTPAPTSTRGPTALDKLSLYALPKGMLDPGKVIAPTEVEGQVGMNEYVEGL